MEEIRATDKIGLSRNSTGKTSTGHPRTKWEDRMRSVTKRIELFGEY